MDVPDFLRVIRRRLVFLATFPSAAGFEQQKSDVAHLSRTKIDAKFDMPLSGAAAEGVAGGYALVFECPLVSRGQFLRCPCCSDDLPDTPVRQPRCGAGYGRTLSDENACGPRSLH